MYPPVQQVTAALSGVKEPIDGFVSGGKKPKMADARTADARTAAKEARRARMKAVESRLTIGRRGQGTSSEGSRRKGAGAYCPRAKRVIKTCKEAVS